MNYPLDDKNIAIWNDQPLDIWSDIIVSFDYARYAVNFVPTGGFAVVFFDSITNAPRNGGRDYSLGYIPNDTKDYCLQGGYTGLEAAYVGVGFDRYGYFALNTYAPGQPLSSFVSDPSITIRNGVGNNYELLHRRTLSTFLSTLPTVQHYTIDQSLTAETDIIYRSVRIILSKGGTELKVQIKENANDLEYITVAIQSLPRKDRSSLKVAITNTTQEGLTQFKIKNFNVAGYPGFPTLQRIRGCTQKIVQNNYGNTDSLLCMGDEFISNVLPGKIATYASNTVEYLPRNNIFYGTGITLFGQDKDTIVGKYNGSPIIGIFDYLGERLYRTSSIITPDNNEPISADIHNTTLAVCTDTLSGSIYIYQFNSSVEQPESLGTWGLYQSITTNDVANSIGMGSSVQISGDNMLVGDTSNDRVFAFRKGLNQRWTHIQTISSPISSVTNFGASIAIDGDDAIIGAPTSQKLQYNEPAQGEAYHYVYNSSTNQWTLVMYIGSFYNLNTPQGNFGASVALDHNYALIGCPGEEYRETPDSPSFINVGRVYVFRKTSGGVFSQSTVLAPTSGTVEPYMFFGSKVAIYKDLAAVLSPFTTAYIKSYIDVYNLTCAFELPPTQIPIPVCALQLIDYSGFVLDTFYNTYMLSYTCQLVGPLPS